MFYLSFTAAKKRYFCWTFCAFSVWAPGAGSGFSIFVYQFCFTYLSVQSRVQVFLPAFTDSDKEVITQWLHVSIHLHSLNKYLSGQRCWWSLAGKRNVCNVLTAAFAFTPNLLIYLCLQHLSYHNIMLLGYKCFLLLCSEFFCRSCQCFRC